MLEPWTTPRRSSPACWCARSCPWARQSKEDLERRLVPVSSGKQFGTKLSIQHRQPSEYQITGLELELAVVARYLCFDSVVRTDMSLCSRPNGHRCSRHNGVGVSNIINMSIYII